MNEIKNDVAEEYLRVIKFDFEKYKLLGDKTFEQLSEDDFYFKTGKVKSLTKRGFKK